MNGGDVTGGLAMLTSAAAVGAGLIQARQAQRKPAHRTRWGLLVALNATAGVLALLTAVVDPRAGDGFCYQWALLAAAGASAGLVAWRRGQRLTWLGVESGLFGLTLLAQTASRGLPGGAFPGVVLAVLVGWWLSAAPTRNSSASPPWSG